ncbi:MAG: hypothetical protein DWQ35_01390 [Planctomycetota bacterium]|nr:MAG: hypothetical protein DWQ35_01390 [Planctomycetota bacterium]
MQVAELTRRLGVPYRHVRYVLEQGILPKGVAESPGRGEHRDLTPAQAFWLAIVLVLKENGVKTPMAGKLADHAARAIPGIAANASWEWHYNPFQGRIDTEFEWYLDIGDSKYVRIATTANPSVDGVFEFEWSKIGRFGTVREVDPLVVIRLDIARLGRLLKEQSPR